MAIVLGLFLFVLVLASRVLAFPMGLGAVRAQDDPIPGPRPVHLVTGTCAEPGILVFALNSLTAPGGTLEGTVDRDRTETSNTANVPLTIDSLLASPHALQLLSSDEETAAVLACGNLGGVREGNGALVIGLREQDGSHVTGIAYLAPNANNPVMTIASIFASGSGLGTAIGSNVPVTPVPVLADPPSGDGDDDPDDDEDGDDDDDDEDD